MSAEFQRDYQIRLPLPLAQVYARAHNAKDVRARHDNAFYLFEVAVKLAAAPLVSYYLQVVERGVKRLPAIDRLLVSLALPSLGHWVAMLRELARHFGSQPDAPSHPLGLVYKKLTAKIDDRLGLLELYRRIKNGPDGEPGRDTTCSLLQLFEAMVQYRNGVFGHGGPRFESFYGEIMGPLLFPAVNELLAEEVFNPLGPPGSRLVYVSELRTLEDGRLEVGLRDLIGLQSERLAPLVLTPAQAGPLLPGRVGVLWPGKPVPLRLDPLLVYRETDLSDELLFLNRDRNGRQVEYLSYTTGKVERDAATAPALAALLARVTGRPVDDARLEALTNESRAEARRLEPSGDELPPAASAQGEFEVLAEIGRGGMGIVYLARQFSLGRHVALKMLPAELQGDEVALARFRREMRLLARCDHPNIVKVLASGSMPDGQLYYAMEYVPGCDLECVWRELSGSGRSGDVSRLAGSTWDQAVVSATRKTREQMAPRTIAGRKPDEPKASGTATTPDGSPFGLSMPALPDPLTGPADPGAYSRRVAALVRDAALALQAVHDQQIIHRDVKPANLMLTPDGSRVVLMDFGLARSQSLDLTRSRTGDFKGTLRYASPEQIAASSLVVGPQSDVRALGVTLWELLTHRRLFEEASDNVQLATLVFGRDVPRLHEIDPKFDADLEAVVARATERRAEDRIATAGKLAEYLQLYLDGRPLPIRPPTAAEMLGRWVREHRPQVAIAGAAAAAVLITVVTSFLLINQARLNEQSKADENLQLAKDKTDLANQNGRLARDEQAQRERAEARLVRNYITNGVQALAGGDTIAALPWFTTALSLETNDAERTVHRLRLAALLRESPSLVHAWFHDDTINHAELSSDGRYVVTASADKTARVWDAPTGAPVTPPLKHTDQLGLHEVPATRAGDPLTLRLQGEVTIGTARRFIQQASFQVNDSPKATTPRSPRAASGAPDPNQTGKDSPTAKGLIRDPDDLSGMSSPAQTGPSGKMVFATFSPDSRRVATASDESTVIVWDIATGKTVSKVKMGAWYDLKSIVFSPDGRRLLSLASFGKLRVWNAETGEAISADIKVSADVVGPKRMFDPTIDIRNELIRFNGDGSKVVAAYEDRTIRIWDAATGKLAGQLGAYEGDVNDFSFSPNGRQLVIALSDGSVNVMNLAEGHGERHGWKLRDSVNRATFSRDGLLLVTACKDGTAQVWSAATGGAVGKPLSHSAPVSQATMSPDCRFVVTICSDGKTRIWDLVDPTSPRLIPGASKSAEFSADGRRLLTTTGETARLWNVVRARADEERSPIKDGWTSVSFSADGLRAVAYNTNRSGRSARNVVVHDTRTSQPISADLSGEKDFLLQHAAISPDGRLVATSCFLSGHIWDVATGKITVTLPQKLKGKTDVVEETNSFYYACFSPDGRRLATATGGFGKYAAVWDVTSGSLVSGPLFHEQPVWRVAFSPDGRRLVTSSGENWGRAEGQARVWYLATGKPISTISHTDRVNSASFSPDGRLVVTAGSDGLARICYAETGKPICPPLKQGGEINGAAFSTDGRFVVTAGSQEGGGGLVTVWDAATGDPVTPPLHHFRSFREAHIEGTRIVATSGQPFEVCSWPFVPDDREPEQLELLARTLSGSQVDDTGGYLPAEFRSTWESLVQKYRPQPPQTNTEALLAWSRREAREDLATGIWNAAIWHLSRLIEAEPAQRSHREERGLAYASLNLWTAAAHDLSRAIDMKSDDPRVWSRLGSARVNLGEWSEAASATAKAIELAIGRGDSINELTVDHAMLRLGLDDIPSYRDACTKLLAMAVKDDSAAFAYDVAWLAALTPDSGLDPDDMERLARRAVRRDSKNYDYLLGQAAALLRKGQFEEALKGLDAVASSPGGPTVFDRLLAVIALQKLGRAQDAKKIHDSLDDWFAKHKPEEPGGPGSASHLPWKTRIAARILRKEAVATLRAPSSGKLEPPQSSGIKGSKKG